MSRESAAPRPLQQAAQIITFRTPGRGMLDITNEVVAWVQAQSMTTGLLTLFCRHTSASLLIQENASSAVQRDLEEFLSRLAPEDAGLYEHDEEGPDDMPAHLRTALTPVQLSIPLIEGRLALGTWQGLYLYEHRRRAHQRQVALHLIGE